MFGVRPFDVRSGRTRGAPAPITLPLATPGCGLAGPAAGCLSRSRLFSATMQIAPAEPSAPPPARFEVEDAAPTLGSAAWFGRNSFSVKVFGKNLSGGAIQKLVYAMAALVLVLVIALATGGKGHGPGPGGRRPARDAATAVAGGTCRERPPANSQFTCEQQAGWDKCGAVWMRGYCCATCTACAASCTSVYNFDSADGAGLPNRLLFRAHPPSLSSPAQASSASPSPIGLAAFAATAEPSLLLFYDLNEGGGTAVHDGSSHHRDVDLSDERHANVSEVRAAAASSPAGCLQLTHSWRRQGGLGEQRGVRPRPRVLRGGERILRPVAAVPSRARAHYLRLGLPPLDRRRCSVGGADSELQRQRQQPRAWVLRGGQQLAGAGVEQGCATRWPAWQPHRRRPCHICQQRAVQQVGSSSRGSACPPPPPPTPRPAPCMLRQPICGRGHHADVARHCAAVFDDTLGPAEHLKLYIDSVEYTDPDATEVFSNLMKGHNARCTLGCNWWNTQQILADPAADVKTDPQILISSFGLPTPGHFLERLIANAGQFEGEWSVLRRDAR